MIGMENIPFEIPRNDKNDKLFLLAQLPGTVFVIMLMTERNEPLPILSQNNFRLTKQSQMRLSIQLSSIVKDFGTKKSSTEIKKIKKIIQEPMKK